MGEFVSFLAGLVLGCVAAVYGVRVARAHDNMFGVIVRSLINETKE